MEKKKSNVKFRGIGLIVVVVALVLYVVSVYNGVIQHDEAVMNSWGNVETQYQRRLDLVPNLVSTVKAYADHERETFDMVVEARAKATQVTIDPSQLNAENVRQFEQVQEQLSGAIARLLAVSEAYPELKASENFLILQSQLEGTENRISVARRAFNKSTNDYNRYVRTFPNNVIVGVFGFAKKDYFEADTGAEKAVDVQF
ncbi:LemA family protein [Porphyromonas sp.]|uniref:LemA family protein n=1 Tax=Porphyromonas sp. TaxID=1924944 RepID=UPI0026DB9686|nr:LemA family protein [Porphyromonas sp.]MDO4771573.1 LemA family protein [Porphyromonas sp.]